ncbi:hypothetical protein GCM10025857_00780 [Alicyclobacillus contaminans]|nr:hypothetical protein GCM10025857_00780 [Alicyclobacillus contaminans]
MFEQGFATLFRAVDRIQAQMETADPGLRRYLLEELLCIQQLGERCIDGWMTLDEKIAELVEMYGSDVPKAEESEWSADFKPLEAHQSTSPSRTDATLSAAPNAEKDDWMEAAFDLSNPVTLAFRKGLAYYDLYMYSNAADSLEQAVAREDNPLVRLYLAASYTAAERYPEALEQIERVRNRTAEPLFLAGADELEALAWLKLGDPARAVACLRRVADCLPKYPDVWFNLGVAHILHQKLDEALDALNRAVQMNPNDIESLRLLGYVHLRREDHEAALFVCQQALEGQPLNPSLLELLAVIQRAAGQWSACIRTCRKLLDVNPTSGPAHTLLAWVYMRMGDLPRAATVLKRRITLGKDCPDALLQLGLVHLMQGDVERAEAELARSLAHVHHRSLAWMGLGRCSALQGRMNQARTRYLRAMRETRKPLRRLAMYSYARLLMELGQYEQAESYLKGRRCSAAQTRPSI